MTSRDEDDPPPGEKVRRAIAGKKPVTAFTVVEGGRSGKSKAPRRSRPKHAEAKEPLAPEGDAGPPKEPLAPESTADGPKRPDGVGPETWDTVRRCAEQDQNDRGNGQRIINHFGHLFCYVAGLGWLTWRGTHWQRDEGELEVRRMAQDLVDLIKLEHHWIVATPAQRRAIDQAAPFREIADQTKEQEKAIAKADEILDQLEARRGKRKAWAVTSGNAGRTSAMLTQAASFKAIDQNVLDADHYLFNVKNGTLKLWREPDPEQDQTPEADGTPIPPRLVGRIELQPHDSRDRITKLADVEFVDGASCPEFQKFLDRTQPRADMQRFLQVFHAYAMMIGGNGVQKLAYHYGLGANGKSAFIEATGRLAGSYRTVVSPDTLVGESQRQGQQASPDIARLFNTRYVTVEELPKGVPLKEDLVKAVSGGTKMTARFLQKEFFEFLPIFTAVLSGNHRPTITGSDFGIWRRVLLVHWAETIGDAEKIEFDDLMAIFDRERPGILNWLIEGARLYLTHGMTPFIPASVVDYTNEYRRDRDNIGTFAEAMIVPEAGSSVQAGTLYKLYVDWCEVNGLVAAKQRTFGDRLSDLGYRKDTGRVYVYRDISVRPNPKLDPVIFAPAGDSSGDPGWTPPA